MATRRSRLDQLEAELQFRTWLDFARFLESLSDEQVEDVAIYWRFPDPLPEPLPMGESRLDGLDRDSLIKLWQESEREISRLMRENTGRTKANASSTCITGTGRSRRITSRNVARFDEVVSRHDEREPRRI
jgi:hypothetical protein